MSYLIWKILAAPGVSSSAGAFLWHLLADVLKAVLVAAVLVVLGWFAGPFKWLWRSIALRNLILNRREFVLVYNPQNGYRKIVLFLDGGRIGEGMNNNENSWRVRRGALEFIADDGKLWNRFKLDKASGRLMSTNDSKIRTLVGQYLEPQHMELPKS